MVDTVSAAQQPQPPPPQQQQSIRGFATGEDFLNAMIADLADWLAFMHDCQVPADPEGFFGELDSGILLCRHAVMVQAAAAEYFASAGPARRPLRAGASVLSLPPGPPPHRIRAPAGSFMARDNVACFIGWCRRLGLPNCLLFETEDLVGRKNPRSVVLCLLELARAGARFGLEVPDLVHFEQEIDAELSGTDSGLASPSNSLQSVPEQADASPPAAAAAPPTSMKPTPPHPHPHPHQSMLPHPQPHPHSQLSPQPQSQPQQQTPAETPAAASTDGLGRRRHKRWQCDLRSLDELVRELVKECVCDETFPMKRLDEGKYLFGDSQLLIFVRVLRNHVMVRVGGGWDSLEHLLHKHDPCRKDAACGAATSGVPVGHREERERRRRLLMSPAPNVDAADTDVGTDQPDCQPPTQPPTRQLRRKMSAPTLSLTELAALTNNSRRLPQPQNRPGRPNRAGGVERQGFAELRDLRRRGETPPTSTAPTPTPTPTLPTPARRGAVGRRPSLQIQPQSHQHSHSHSHSKPQTQPQPQPQSQPTQSSRIPVPVNPVGRLLSSTRLQSLSQQQLRGSTGSLT